jgi:predicted O-methyltransferase YrrM
MRDLRRRLFRPGSAASSVVYRTLMAASTPRVRGPGRRDGTPEEHAAQAIARALMTAAFGRLSPQERAWATRIEARRRELDASSLLIRPRILAGGGAAANKAREGPIPVAASAWLSLPRVWCVFLMRLVGELAPRSCLELGTGFGISGAYTAASLELSGGGMLTTLEKAIAFAEVAEQGFASLGLSERTDVRVGPIGDTLDEAVERAEPIDLAFLDADHREQPTLDHFHAILPALSEGAVVVLDDINWEAEGMPRAWRTIRSHPRTALALGLRRVGLCVVSEPRP